MLHTSTMLPTSLNIQGMKWSVKIIEDLTDDGGRPCHGLCSPSDRTIYIRDEELSIQLRTFIHETCHAICFQSGLWYAPSWNPDMEEILAEQFANFFVTNRAVLSFPVKRKKKRAPA